MYAKIIGDTVALANIHHEGFVEVVEVPDGTFDNTAFELQGDKVVVNFDKAKEQAHDMRRAKRDAAYKPIDGGSPYVAVDETGEAKRLEVKTPDDEMQVAIDACASVEELYALISIEGQL